VSSHEPHAEQRRRAFAAMTTNLLDDAEAARLARTAAVWFPLRRDVVAVEGPDAQSYLQGQLSADVDALADGGARPTLLLSPQGKLVAWLRVTRLGPERFLLDGDAGRGEAVVERLSRFRLRTKVRFALLDWRAVALRGPGSDDLVAALASGSTGAAGGAQALLGPVPPAPGDPAGSAETASALPGWLPAAWPGLAGWDLLGPDPLPPPGVGLASDTVAEALRVESGVPRWDAELDERVIPAEAGLVEDAVSFTKGCYTGQELVARIDARGSRVPRHLAGLVVPGMACEEAARLAGAALWRGERQVGAVTSAACSAGLGAVVALAYVKREIDVPSEVELEAPTGARLVAQVRALPLLGS